MIEEKVARRVEELVAKRVEEELEKRKDEIETEVLRRVEEAKRVMEQQMLHELELQRQAEMEAQKLKEVKLVFIFRFRRHLCLTCHLYLSDECSAVTFCSGLQECLVVGVWYLFIFYVLPG